MVTPESPDLVRRAEQLYEERLKAQLESTHRDEFVAIEPDSGDYFVAREMGAAIAAARRAHPDRLTYVIHVGHPATLEVGGWTP